MNFVTTRKEALDAMERYIENNISDYTAKRNFDFGPQNRKNISCLSPYITHRLISEYEVAKKTLDCLIKNVPAELPGVTFLSGGQSDILATAPSSARFP